MKKILKIISIFIIIIIVLLIMENIVFALDINSYQPGQLNNADKLKDLGNIIIGIIQVVGSALSVIVLIIIGIKYLVGSAEEKAEFKETMMPYIIGCVFVFAITNILAIVSDIMANAFNQ